VVQPAPIIGIVGTEPAGEHPVVGTTAETPAPATKVADNPILPTGGELAWGLASFVVLWALMKFVLLKPILKTMEERAAKVRGDLEAAETARAQAAASLAEYEESLASARLEATHVIDEARSEAEDERRRILAAAEAEVSSLRAAANADVERAKDRALQEMRSSVATIAVQAAEIVVQKRLDAAAQRAIVDEYLNRASQN
jgi:F-type H+-transporting ATPase subunit b